MDTKRIVISLTAEQYDKVEKKAEFVGLKVSSYIKSEAVKQSCQADGKNRIIIIEVDNYSELVDYACSKKFGNVESFITFAVNQYMTRYPVKNA